MAESNNTLVVLAVLAVVLAFIALISVFYSVAVFSGITGQVTGEANLTIAAVTSINISNGSIEWGEGIVTEGSSAVFNTSFGTVGGGNWTTVKTGMLIQNSGNVNVTIDLATSKGNASSFIGATAGALYEWNISNYEVRSCISWSVDGIANNFTTVNGTTAGTEAFKTRVCNVFGYIAAADVLELDFSVVIPETAPTGIKTDTITITATAV